MYYCAVAGVKVYRLRGVATNGGGLKLIKGPTDPQWSESAET